MINRLYLKDGYQKAVDTFIETVDIIDGATAFTCSELIFHPEGGGQPDDRGVVVLGGSIYRIKKLIKRKGDVFVTLESKIPQHDDLFFGEAVTCQLEWEYRYKAMRYHTAAHVLMAAAKRVLSDYQPKGIMISEDLTNCQIRFASNATISQEVVDRIFDMFNSAVQSDLPVEVRTYSSVEEARTGNKDIFRMDPALQLKGSIRVIIIDGFDANPCGGTHVRTLSEIGAIKPASFDASAISFSL